MVGERNFFELGRQLATIGLDFKEIKKRISSMSNMQEQDKRDIFKGFANVVMGDKPEEAYRAGKEVNDYTVLRDSSKRLLSNNLRTAQRLAIDLDDEELMESVIREAEMKKDTITAEIMKRHLKDKKLKDIHNEYGI
ncbi:MAG: hypothetical protein KJ767_03150 [Nanoarchaeota archaeon]|nr:hypothetical protein [Nanoarchaeota archaeon]